MKSTKLPISTYNDTWINCVYNNLLGVLIDRDKRFDRLPDCVKYRYELNTISVEYSGELDREIREHGWLMLQCSSVPNLNYEKDYLSNWFELEEFDYDVISDVLAQVSANLQLGKYTLVDVDRYYLPGGIEHKQKHRIHPTFIYGVDVKTRELFLIEDCVRLGIFEYYTLSFDDFYRALCGAQSAKKPEIFSYKLRSLEQPINVTKAFLLNYMETCLADDISFAEFPSYPYLTTYRGPHAVKQFSERVRDVLAGLNEQNVDQQITFSAPQKFYTSLRGLLGQSTSLIAPSQMRQMNAQIESIKKLWEEYKLRGYRFIYERKSGGLNRGNLDSMVPLLESISVQEAALRALWIELANQEETFALVTA
jgi:hypothetical protein